MRIACLLALAILLPAFVQATTLININTADAALLDTLPGIGPSTAQKIIEYRDQNGVFATVEDLLKVPGIGPSTLENLRPLITVQ